MQMNRKALIRLVLLLAIAALLDSYVALKASTTTDEPLHLTYGVHVLQGNPDRQFEGYFDSQMPISALNAVPMAIAGQLKGHERLGSLAVMLGRPKTARFATILGTLVLTLFVYLWALDLYGEGVALVACLLCMLSPNLIAHGTLVTTDMYHALGVVGSLFFFRRYLLQPTWQRAIIAALALALAQTTKPFALALYVVVALALLLALFVPAPYRRLSPKRALLFVGSAAICFVAIINLAYCFDRPFFPLSSYYFENSLFKEIQRVPVLSSVPLLLPYPFLQGLDMTRQSELTGRSF